MFADPRFTLNRNNEENDAAASAAKARLKRKKKQCNRLLAQAKTFARDLDWHASLDKYLLARTLLRQLGSGASSSIVHGECAAALDAEVLLLAMVPPKAESAQQLINGGTRLDAPTRAALLEPDARGVSAWRRLQLDADARRVVDSLMLSEPELGAALDAFLVPEHAARAADLLEAAGKDAVIKLGLGGGLPQLLRPWRPPAQ